MINDINKVGKIASLAINANKWKIISPSLNVDIKIEGHK